MFTEYSSAATAMNVLCRPRTNVAIEEFSPKIVLVSFSTFYFQCNLHSECAYAFYCDINIFFLNFYFKVNNFERHLRVTEFIEILWDPIESIVFDEINQIGKFYLVFCLC